VPDAPAPPSIAQWMARATTTTAATVQIDPVRASFLEARPEHDLIDAWAADGGEAFRARVQLRVPGWDPRPGATDSIATTAGGDLLAAAPTARIPGYELRCLQLWPLADAPPLHLRDGHPTERTDP